MRTQPAKDNGAVNFEHIVGDSTLRNGGYTGRLLTLLSVHVKESIKDNLVSQTEAGAILVTGVEKALSMALQFELQDKLTEAKIAVEEKQLVVMDHGMSIADAQLILAQEMHLADLALKQKQLEIAEQELAIKEQELLIAQERLKEMYVDIEIKEEKLLADQYTRIVMLPAKVEKENEQARLYERQRIGFDDHKKQQGYDKVMETWGITYSSLPTSEGVADMMRTDNVNQVMYEIYTDQLGISASFLENCPENSTWVPAKRICVEN